MPLQPQTASIPLYGGIDTKTDAKYVAGNMMLSAQNVRFFGVNSAQKRYGQTALTQNVGVSGQQITAGKALGSFNNELLAFDGSALYSYAQAAGVWASRGALTEVLLTPTPIIRSSGSVTGIASALTGTTELYAWEDSRGGVWYAVRDPSSGAFTVSATQLDANGASPQVVVAGALTYIFFAVGPFIWQVTLNTTNPAGGIVSRSLVAGNGTTGTPFAAISSTGSALAQNTIMLVYQESGGSTFHIKLFTFGLVLLFDTTFTYAVTAALHISAAFSTDGSRALALVTTAAAVKLIPINTASGANSTAVSAYTATAALKASAVGMSASTINIYWDDQGSGTANINNVLVTFTAATSVTLGSILSLQGTRLASIPVLLGSTPYLIGCSALTNIAGATSQQTSFFLINGTSLAIIQRFFGDSAFLGGTVIPNIVINASGQLFVALGQRTALRADANGTIYSQVGITNCYFTFPTASQVKISPFGNTALINCGSTYTYDGAQLVESGFWEFPDGITATTAGGGGNLNAGSYIYVATYEWIDATGNVHYSSGSYPVIVTTVVNDRVTLTLPYTALTRKTDAIIGIYRTATSPGSFATPDTGLGPWFKVATLPNKTDGTLSVTYTDGASDASLQGQQFLYAPPDGTGEVDNDAPPPFSFVVATKTRIFGIAQDDPTALWYTKPVAYGRPAEWSSAFVNRVEQDGGAVTALTALDTQAIIFKRHKIEYLPGDGPNAAGQNAFGNLQLITSTSGCTVAPSVLQTSDGVYYKSDIGISVLTRGLSVDISMGLPVQGFNALNITGAQSISAQNQLRWTSSDGTCLVYDYVTKCWSTYTNYDSVAYCLWQEQGTRLRSTGQVLFEDSTTYLDAGAPIIMQVETSWQKLSSIAQGYGAIWYAMILGDYFSSHTLNVEIAYDYIDTAFQTVTWNATTNGNFGTFGSGATFGSDPVFGANVVPFTTPYQVRVAIARQTCEAIKFKIYDSGVSGQSCTLNEIAVQLGVIGGLNRGPTRQQVQ